MKAILRGYGIRMNTEERQVARSQADDMTRTRGTDRRPNAPRAVFLQSGPRGILVNWQPGAGLKSDIAGYRIYKDDEFSLFAEIHESVTTQHFIDSSAGSTPPVTNIFVSSISKLGKESPLVQAQSVAIVEAAAPPFPGTPGGYGTNFGGGGGGGAGGGGRGQLR
jgi:hypothetical protein